MMSWTMAQRRIATRRTRTWTRCLEPGWESWTSSHRSTHTKQKKEGAAGYTHIWTHTGRRADRQKGRGCIHSNLNTANPVSLYCILATPLPPPLYIVHLCRFVLACVCVTKESSRKTRLLRSSTLTVTSE